MRRSVSSLARAFRPRPHALLLPILVMSVGLGGSACRPREERAAQHRSATTGRGSATATAASSGQAPRPVERRFDVGWDPTTGKGELTQHYDDGAVARVCLQCRFPGYTGGLVIGSYGGSGFEYVPPVPRRGFASLNVFCAQDESIWDQSSSREYAFGWSENFGSGPDGERLSYVSGGVEQSGPERVLLWALNRGGCYEVHKRLLWTREARYVLVHTRIRNGCASPIAFDFWTGDDPWLGRYRSSEGDVGYTDRSLVHTETRVDPKRFRYGGVYDLGNSAAGEQEGHYSGAANFVMLGPAVAPPDRIYFANRFAHDDEEIHPGRPLTNDTMLAFNLGWVDRRLGAGEHLDVLYALGLADSTGEAVPPRAPTVPAREWATVEPPHSALEDLRFDRERIELSLRASALEVVGRYVIANDGAQPRTTGIYYPFPSDADHPAPDFVELDGRRLERFDAHGVRFPLRLPARGTTSFTVRYRQRHRSSQATYIVTSARHWGRPIRHAEFVLRYPRTLRNVRVNYPADRLRTVGELLEYQFARDDFAPERDVVIDWD